MRPLKINTLTEIEMLGANTQCKRQTLRFADLLVKSNSIFQDARFTAAKIQNGPYSKEYCFFEREKNMHHIMTSLHCPSEKFSVSFTTAKIDKQSAVYFASQVQDTFFKWCTRLQESELEKNDTPSNTSALYFVQWQHLSFITHPSPLHSSISIKKHEDAYLIHMKFSIISTSMTLAHSPHRRHVFQPIVRILIENKSCIHHTKCKDMIHRIISSMHMASPIHLYVPKEYMHAMRNCGCIDHIADTYPDMHIKDIG